MANLDLEKLVELMSRAGAEKSAAVVLEEWKQQYDRGVADAQARAEQLAREQPMRYGVQRLERKLQASGGSFVEVLQPVEVFDPTIDELPTFAKSIGCSLGQLTAMLDGHTAEVTGKGGKRYRSWSTPRWSNSRDFVDRTEKDKDLATIAREDQRLAEFIQHRNDMAQKAGKPTDEPTHNTNWRN